jgi:hypothetical protein
MTEQYKRSICHMCSSKDDCDGVRWATVCGACPESLKCAAGPGIGHDDCKKLRAVWLALPRKCMLASHLVNQKANHDRDAFTRNDEGAMVCPRCQQSVSQIYVDHGLNYLFKRVTKYIFTCDYCGLDETIEVA